MIFWVGITDTDWFNHLSDIKPDEVNFWQPGKTRPMHMEPGTLFLFKLHSPQNYVVGGGFFVRFTVLPCFLAWEAFQEKNGVKSLRELIARMTHYRHAQQTAGSEIGCNILTQPFFIPEADWIPIPENWSPNIVRGRSYDTNEDYGAGLWEAVHARIDRLARSESEVLETERYGNEFLTRTRLGQGSFRILVTDAYHRRCAVTNENTLPALEAAHIKSYHVDGPHRISNGLLLRADIHRLFDDGYVTIDPDCNFLVSRRVKEEFENGREYYRFHGLKLQNLPDSINDLPSQEFVKWHNEECFEQI